MNLAFGDQTYKYRIRIALTLICSCVHGQIYSCYFLPYSNRGLIKDMDSSDLRSSLYFNLLIMLILAQALSLI